MKKLLVVFLVFFTSTVYSENSIMAIVNNYPITFTSLKTKLVEVNSKNERLIIIRNHIDNILQLQEAKELNLAPGVRSNLLNLVVSPEHLKKMTNLVLWASAGGG